MDIRTLQAKLLHIAQVDENRTDKGCSLLSPDDAARALALKHSIKEGFDLSGFTAPSGLDSLPYLRRNKPVHSDLVCLP